MDQTKFGQNISKIEKNQDIQNSNITADELPLLEEIGIDVDQVKSWVANTLLFWQRKNNLLKNPDLTGPIFLAVLLGILLMLNKKLSFGFIFGFSFFGGFCVYFIYNMIIKTYITFYVVQSILGYCMTPILLIALFNLFFNFKNFYGITLSSIIAIYCSYLVIYQVQNNFEISKKRFLLAYPTFLFYLCFVIIIIS